MGRRGLAVAIAACVGWSCAGSATRVVLPRSVAQRRAELTERKRIVTLEGRRSGDEVTRVNPDGSISVHEAVLENGRGPTVDGTFRLGATGLIQSADLTGHAEMGQAVDDHFRRETAVATWKNVAENGSSKDVDAFYVPLYTPDEVWGFLAEALLRAPGNALKLLPAGVARIDPVTKQVVHGPLGEETLSLFLLAGLDFTPVPVWMDAEDHFFGTVWPRGSSVPEGFEADLPAMLAVQERTTIKRLAESAQQLAHRMPEGGLALTHARVFDAEHRSVLEDQTVIFDRTIRAIGPAKSLPIPPTAQVIDVQNRMVLPGLWDMHTHGNETGGLLAIGSGITTVRDLGNDSDKLLQLKQDYDRGTLVGPRLVMAGLIEGRGKNAAASKITAMTLDEATKAVEYYKGRGYEQIKVYNSYPPELVAPTAQIAHQAGMRVSGHVPVHMTAEQCVRAGYDELQHITMLFLNFFVDRDTDTTTTLRFSLVGDRAPGLDLDSKPVRDFIALLSARKTVVDPTLAIFEQTFTARFGQPWAWAAPILNRLPPLFRRSTLAGDLPVPEGKDAQYRAAFQAQLAMVHRLWQAGVPLVVGTDDLPLVLPRDLELYVQAGIPAPDVLALATLGAARVMHHEAQSGSVAVGKDADLVLVDGDPTRNISDVRRVISTWRGGTRYDATEVFASVGVGPPG